MDYIEIPTSPASVAAYSFIGLTCLTFINAMYGFILVFFQFLRLGPRRFFRKVDRPKPPEKAMDPIYGEHQMMKLKSSGISVHYVSKGLPNQPMIMFIHGFPECWYSWRNQMKYFSKDYRVVAIDQRGYGLSSKPPFISDYRTEVLAGDVADLIEQMGYESCILVGHDWGGIVAWTTAMLYPHLVEKLIVMNAPHPIAWRLELTLAQLFRSWYMFFYQSPLVPEKVIQADDFAIFQQLFHKKPVGLVNKEAITDEDIEVYKYTFSQEGTTKAAINYYRALFQLQSDFSRAEISAPVLVIWGCQDPAAREEMADMCQKYCSDIRIKKIPNASHWVNQDVPDVVNKYMEIFLKENPAIEQTYDF